MLSILPLYRFIKKDKPDYIIAHLITSLPIFLFKIFKFKTKLILRISGYPKLNFIRKFFWKLCSKNIHLITCPSIELKNQLSKLNIFENKKIVVLYDSVINIKEVNKQKNDPLSNEITKSNYLLAIGRLTKQKNFMFLCKAFRELIQKDNEIKLVIVGSGEEETKLKKFIKKNDLNRNIILIGYVKNIYPYFKKSRGFILSSLWEDPGFVLIEASYCRSLILSSNSWPGPVELIKNNFNGILFENNNLDSFLSKFEEFKNNTNPQYLKLNSLRLSRKFTLFNHYKNLNQLIKQ